MSNRIFLIKDGDEDDPDRSTKNKTVHDNDVGAEEKSDDSEKPVTLKRIPIGFCASIKLSFQRIGLVAGCGKCC